MALTKGTNSYATVAEADAYFEDSMHAAAWEALPDNSKAQFLVSATRLVDREPFTGVALSSEQMLAFPRDGEYYDAKLSIQRSMNPTPLVISHAVFELALHLSQDASVLQDAASFSRLTVGPITLERPVSASKVPKSVSDMLKPLTGGSGNVWWRAN